MRHPFVRLDSFIVAISLAASAFLGCSGTTTRGGSESNFQKCSVDTDCTIGVCMGGLCKTQGTGGGTGLLDAGSGGGGAGGHGVAGNHPTFPDAGSGGGRITPIYPDSGAGGVAGGGPGGQGGCLVGTPYDYFASAGGTLGSGGQGSGGVNMPQCSVDADGIATLDGATMCGQHRCAATVDELLTGLTCTQGAAGANEINLAKGCGSQVVTMPSQGFTYSAAFDLAGTTPIAVETRWTVETWSPTSDGGYCYALGHRMGTMPAPCDSATLYSCVRQDAASGQYAGCRAPNEAGCNTCCTPSPFYDCNVLTTTDPAQGYNYYGSVPGHDCPCNCQLCAPCSRAAEDQLRFGPVLTQCHCPAPPPAAGGSPGSGGAGSGGAGDTNPCDSYCPYHNQQISQCPGVVPG